jgi:hypothetical protein
VDSVSHHPKKLKRTTFSRFPVRPSTGTPTILSNCFVSFHASPNTEILFYITPLSLPSTSLPVHYLLIIRSVDAIYNLELHGMRWYCGNALDAYVGGSRFDWIVTRTGHNRFLPNPFQSLVRLPSTNWKL